ncbi:MAG: hypothetical protein U0M22_08545, partial [Acutalibacteraceae bacterium]|nr:hypothetical protein [Acutalibacteraceae bacterium]
FMRIAVDFHGRELRKSENRAIFRAISGGKNGFSSDCAPEKTARDVHAAARDFEASSSQSFFDRMQ